MGAFKVLMWKHYVVRKRRYMQTFIELVTPISLVFVMFMLKTPMEDKVGGAMLELRTYADPQFSLDAVESPEGILYTPASIAARQLMEEVIKSLKRSAQKGRRKFVTSFPVEDVELAVEMLLSVSDDKSNTTYAMVEFKDMEGAELPDNLKYTIRCTSMMRYTPSVQYQRQYEKFEDVPQTFLPLQWAIDTSYLKLKTNSQDFIENVFMEPMTLKRPKKTINKTYVSTVFFLLSYISFGAPLLPFVFLMNRLLEERATGIQELVKMVGVTPAMLNLTQYLNSLPACLIYCIGSIILLKATAAPMVPATSGFILFISQFLHFSTIFAMAYACSHISSDAKQTVSMSLFAYIGMWIPIRLLGHESTSDFFLFFHGLCPHCPSYWFLNEALVAEVRYETGIQFSTLHIRHSTYPDGAKNGSVLIAFIMQIVQIVYFFIASWYLENVRPGKFGVALPWNFLFTKEYWWNLQSIPPEHTDRDSTVPYDPAYKKYFEEPPRNMVAGIKIQNVSKVFGSGSDEFQALNNVNLDIYKGEITVLLGHNGAGKTTLISIITGMIRQTSGKVFVDGKDTVTQQAVVRQQLGFCPQHNLFFPDLNVLEHLMFFSLIKGGSFSDARISSYALMDQLDLTFHGDKKTSELSGGLLRRLQLGCALCGNANVLILDEPTSGLDVEARRELWDTLLSLRGDRTLVLTTHFMEEADVLGDRLAALHLGKLRCHATPMFLKKAIGSGFRINLRTANEPDESKITNTLKQIAPGIVLREVSGKSLQYVLPPGTVLPPLFSTIESKKEELDIKSIGVGITTLEEVFLELCCDVDTDRKRDKESEPQVVFKYVEGYRLLCRQMKELFLRQLDYARNQKFAFVILHIIMPFVLCTSLTQIFNILDKERNQDLILNLNIYEDTDMKEAAFSIKNYSAERAITDIKYAYPEYEFRSFNEFPFLHSLRMADYSGGKRIDWDTSKFAVGIGLNETSARILYATGLKHSAPVAVNLLSNMMALDLLPSSNGSTIETMITNHWPLLTKAYHIPKTKINCSLFAIFNICTLIATTINDLNLPCQERLTIARHTHIMAGCRPFLYWMVTFFFHIIIYICFCCTATIVAARFFDNDKTIDDNATLIAIFVVLALNGVNTYVYMYFISFVFNQKTASLLLVALLVVFGFLTHILILALEDLKTTAEQHPFTKFSNKIGQFIPAFMFTKSLIQIMDTSRFNSFCINNFDKCPSLMYYDEEFDNEVCCSKETSDNAPFKHFSFKTYGAGKSLVIISIQIALFTTLVMLFQYGLFNRWWDLLGATTILPMKRFNCPNVNAERDYVTAHIEAKKQQSNTILMENAWKVYRTVLCTRTYALRGASISIKKGECFGVLGLNGAGKTTTFKVISHEEFLTQGRVLVNGLSSGDEYLRSLGYCPQFCGLDDFRSGNANLRMLLVLRGLSEQDVKKETAAWMEVVGLSKAAHRKVEGYSGGMVRRLATVAALCGGAPLTLLDEPTAGVDTAARRLVWEALRLGTRQGRAIAISSHCMDEIERLCKRVTILSQGEMSVLGTPQDLKEKYAPGHSVAFKLQAKTVQSDSGEQRIRQLDRALTETFDCSMKDRHLTSLHYRIHEKLPYSSIFELMEALVADFQDLIEDYSVAETTLEDVFLTFAAAGDRASMIPRTSRASQSNYDWISSFH